MSEKIEKQGKEQKKEKPAKIGCPICKDTENLQVQGRCVMCLLCGWNKCSL